jgi:hypothetical protein
MGVRRHRIAVAVLVTSLLFAFSLLENTLNAQDASLAKQPKLELSIKPAALNFHTAKQIEQESFALTASGGIVTGEVGSVSPQPSAFTIVSGAGPFTLTPESPTLMVAVQFEPLKKGAYHGKIEIMSDARDKAVIVALSGAAMAPVPTLPATATATPSATSTATPTVTSTPTPVPPALSISVSPGAITEGQTATFTITANPPTSQDLTVFYTLGGTATVWSDYFTDEEGGGGPEVVVPAGASSATVNLTAFIETPPDIFPSSGLTASATLQGAADYIVSTPSSAMVSISSAPATIPTYPAGGSFMNSPGIWADFEDQGNIGLGSGQLIKELNQTDPATSQTYQADASQQLDAMHRLGVNTISFDLVTASDLNDDFVPPDCNYAPFAGLTWPQPTPTELANLVQFLDLLQSKGMKMWLLLTTNHMEEQPPVNATTWLGAILGAIKNHPALDLILLRGDSRLTSNGQCLIPAEPELQLGPQSLPANYLSWAFKFAMALGIPANKLSTEATVDHYYLDPHSWHPVWVLKTIFDGLNIPVNQRTYGLSFYSHQKCGPNDPTPCVNRAPATWEEQTLQIVFAEIGSNNGARVDAIEMGLQPPPTSTWNTQEAIESMNFVMEKYHLDGAAFFSWYEGTSFDPTTTPDPVEVAGTNYTSFYPVANEIIDAAGFHAPILNGSFETGSPVPDHWTIAGNGSGSQYFLAGESNEPQVPSRGQYDLRLITNGTNSGVTATSDSIAVTPSTNYTTTSNLRFNWSGDPNPSGAPTTRPQVYIAFNYLQSSGAPSAIKAQDIFRYFQENSTGDFQTFPMQYTTPADTASMQIVIGAAQNGLPTAITFDADNLR